MDIRVFKTIDSDIFDLIIKSNKSNIIFEIDKNTESKDYKFLFNFTKETFCEFLQYIENISSKIWNDFTPKEPTSMSTDYNEYYDRQLDNNGYLSIRGNSLFIERPSLDSSRLYKFNKGRMESFIYDLKNITREYNCV